MRAVGWLRRHLRVIVALVALAATGIGYERICAYLSWREALRAAGFADELSPPGSGERILIVAPHPDDEVLGCGGLIQRAIVGGAQVDVALMTNGDASELAVIFGDKDLPLRPAEFQKLGIRRQRESLRALARLGLPADHVHFLSFPNNGLLALWQAAHWTRSRPYQSPRTRVSRSPYARCFRPGTLYCGEQVLEDLIALLSQVEPHAVFVTHPQDIHPDHWATAAFVQYALATLRARGVRWASDTRLYGYLIHWPHWPVPRSYAPKLGLLPPRNLLGREDGSWLRLPLDDQQVRNKAAAIRDYRSQEPAFDRLLLSFARTNESFCPLDEPLMGPGETVRWRDESSGRRGLGGAEVLGASLTVQPDLTLRANITCASRPLRKRRHVALDVRTCAPRGQAVLTTVYLRPAGQSAAVRADAHDILETSADIRQQQPGYWRITGLHLTAADGATPLFISCWGSYRDRVTDPAPPDR